MRIERERGAKMKRRYVRRREVDKILVKLAMQGYETYSQKAHSEFSSDEHQRYRDIQPLKTILSLVAFPLLWLLLCLLLERFLALCI